MEEGGWREEGGGGRTVDGVRLGWSDAVASRSGRCDSAALLN